MPYNHKPPPSGAVPPADIQAELLQTARRQLETWQRIETKLDMLFNRIGRMEERTAAPGTVGVDKFPTRRL